MGNEPSSQHAWWTPEQVADHFQMPVKTIRARIRLGKGLPNDRRAIRAINVGTVRKPMYRVSSAEIRRIEQALAQ